MGFKEIEIYKKAFRLTRLLHERCADFPRKYKFTLGDEMLRTSERMTEEIIRANNVRGESRLSHRENLLAEIGCLDFLSDLASRMGVLSDSVMAEIIMLIQDIEEQARRWLAGNSQSVTNNNGEQ
jgi:hypothetical protein